MESSFVAPADPRSYCEVCQTAMPKILAGATEVDHHPKFSALENSALLGCDICRLLRQRLIYDDEGSVISLRETDGAVRLEAYNHTLHVRIEGGSSDVASYIYRADRSQRWLTARPIHRLIFDDPSSLDPVASLAKQWINNCRMSHSTCNMDHGTELRILRQAPALPTRVTAVGCEDAASPPRLVLPGTEGHELEAEYVTLSYCWGIPEHNVRTTKTNLKEMQKEIQWSVLPRTFQDAITFTRKLGVPYLWVDALCIIQPEAVGDDIKGWQYEASRMGQYYQNSYCTIAATGGSDCIQGCFLERHGLDYPVRPCPLGEVDESTGELSSDIVLEPAIPVWGASILRSPLLRRAWVLQERALARRILHFAKDCVYWECQELKASEYQPEGLDDQEFGTIPPFGEKMTNFREFINCSREERLGKAWYGAVQEYSGLKLSVLTDKLPAISAVARRIQEYEKGNYVAGVWMENLAEGIAWTAQSLGDRSLRRTTQEFVAPSWSWASFHTRVTFLRTDPRSWEFVLGIEKVAVEPLSSDPTGLLLSGRLRVRGHFRVFSLAKKGFRRAKEDRYLYEMKKWTEGRLYFDNLPRKGFNWESIPCLQIATSWIGHSASLVLEPTGKADSDVVEYRRIGLLELGTEKDWWEGSDTQTVDLL